MTILARFVSLKGVCKEWMDEVEDMMVENYKLRLSIWDPEKVGVTMYTAYIRIIIINIIINITCGIWRCFLQLNDW
jgi:hypothetical protein